jgi:hypothetical protein
MIKLEEIYSMIRKSGYTKSQYDFSENWLGHSQSYLSTIKSREQQPSAKSLYLLAHRLELLLKGLERTQRSTYSDDSHSRLTKAYNAAQLALKQRCLLDRP